MKIRIVYNFPLLMKGYEAITLYPFIFVKGPVIDKVTVKHELEHVRQINRVGLVYFYISYLWYFLVGLIGLGNWKAAYYNIPYEREAFDAQETPLTKQDLELLVERPRFQGTRIG